MEFVKKSDMWIILIIIIISIAAWFIYRITFSEQSAKAEIYYYSELAETIDLGAGIEKTFSIPQNNHVIFHLYEDGNIRFEESDCPDKICIQSGKLNMIGQNAACIPNGIILKIVPAKNYSEDDLDIVVGK
ncbi:NusG domain II-containing protein [Cellulosilyticum sp. I15G10I2]|uniref:NusG domain II-containing protein n=1 Tax=Cellulosilyticum sp. I15G10I2 TaxID=1892843 RepID=UPI00085C620A|nr:NusG domain II-containing protein [Cellulosilyticum sp. I15G10I2]